MPEESAVVDVAQQLADETLFPTALATDAADDVPVEHLDRLADAGFYGLAAPPELSGVVLRSFGEFCAVVETLAGGCLATTFVWVQHHGLVRSLQSPTASVALRKEWLQPLVKGRRRASLTLAGVVPTADRPLLAARPAASGGGWVLDGTAPYVTGWGRVDALLVAARAPDDMVVWSVVDAVEQRGLSVDRLRLVAVDASATVRLGFEGFELSAERVISVDPYDESSYNGAHMLRVNGSLALGVAGRAARLLGSGTFDGELPDVRRALDDALTDDLPGMAEARATAVELALRATAALVVDAGGKGIARDHHAQRLAREAIFLLVFGTRPEIRSSLLHRLRASLSGREWPGTHRR